MSRIRPLQKTKVGLMIFIAYKMPLFMQLIALTNPAAADSLMIFIADKMPLLICLRLVVAKWDNKSFRHNSCNNFHVNCRSV